MTPAAHRNARTGVCAAVAIVAVVCLAVACTKSVDPLGNASGSDTSGGRSAMADHPGMVMPAGTPSAGPLSPARHLGPQGRVGQIVTECAYSHSAPDDPIVFPDEPGMSHEHDFFGNVTTDAFSTVDTLLREPTSCQKQRDTAAYWAPQLLDHGVAVVPSRSIAYYRAAPGVDPTLLEMYPKGLKIIAGDMTATEPLSADLAGWTCGVSSAHSAAPPECPDQAPLRAVMTFPDCWDGVHVDSENHRSHMANSTDGECPASHPVHVAQLTFSIAYPIAGDGHELTLASGSTYGIHADFINSWDQSGLAGEIRLCLHRDVVCGLSSNRDEEPLFTG